MIEEEIKKHEFGPDDDDEIPSILPGAPVSKVIEGLRIEIEKAQAQAVTLSTFENIEADPKASNFMPVIDLEEVRDTILAIPSSREQLVEHPSIAGTWIIQDELGLEFPVTFDRDVLADNSPDVRLLTFGDPLFDLLLLRSGVTGKHRSSDSKTSVGPAPSRMTLDDASVLELKSGPDD